MLTIRVGMFAGLLVGTLFPSIARAADTAPAAPPPEAPAAPAAVTPPAPVAAVTTTTTDALDSVHLRNGGFYRGRVSEVVPGDHVTVDVAGGARTRIPWAEVERVIVSSTPIPPAEAKAAAAAPVTLAAPPMVGPLSRVHITSARSVVLYRRPAGSSAWSQACASPCDQALPIGDTYRISGNGIAQSKEVHLEAGPSGVVELVVDPPSTGGMVAGGVVAGAGGFTAMVGALVALTGAANAGRNCDDFHTYSTRYGSRQQCESAKADGPGLRTGGLIAMGIGAAVAVGGLVIFFNSATTDVSQRSGSARAGGAPSGPRDAFLREPTWRSASSSAEAAMSGPAPTFPIAWTGRF